MSKELDVAEPTAASRQGLEDGLVSPEPCQGPQIAPEAPQSAPQAPHGSPGLYAYQDLILSGLHRLLGGLIGDGARLILIVDERDGNYPQIVGNHPDTWGVFDALTCADDEEPEMGPGSRNRLLN